MKKAIIIMTKLPEAGRVKTRLRSVLAPEESAGLAAAFLRDAEAKAFRTADDVWVAVSPAGTGDGLGEILQHNPEVIDQVGADLGERMLNAFRTVFEKGAEAAVLIGTDSPTFPADFLEQAFEFLEIETDVVLGRTEDGGFFLIGLRKPDERIFRGVEWSSDETFERVWRNVMDLGLHLREVPGWYDVDEPPDLDKLRRELAANENARRRAPHTLEWLEKRF